MLQRRKKARVTVWEGVRVNPPRPRKAPGVVLSGEPGKLLSVISSINASEKYDGRLLQRFTRRLRRLADLVNSGEVEKRTVTEALKLPRDEEAPPLLPGNCSAPELEEFHDATRKPGGKKPSEDKKPYVKRRSSTRVFRGTLEEAPGSASRA